MNHQRCFVVVALDPAGISPQRVAAPPEFFLILLAEFRPAAVVGKSGPKIISGEPWRGLAAPQRNQLAEAVRASP